MAEEKFHLVSSYAPTGDQPQAIAQLVEGVERGDRCQTLLGVTGSGKTFTMANVIAQCNRPTLVLAHNKTLAAQLCTEFRSFFPDNAVEYFVSYYDYYQPEAYIPSTDTYIEKDSAINDEIDRLRHSATMALAERRDVIIVASVSCIYSLGSPEDYRSNTLSLRQGQEISREEVIKRLVEIQYERNEMAFTRNKFRAKGDTLEIFPAGGTNETAVRVEFFGDEIDRISEFNALTSDVSATLLHVVIFPASHYIVGQARLHDALHDIAEEMEQRVKYFTEHNKLIEAQRIEQRTRYDMEMLSEIDLAYAQTVHKAQGSEYRCVVLAALPSAPSLMVRGVLYTALTRARELLVIVGDDAAIRSMAANDRQQKRYSGLKWRLCHAGDTSE